MGYSCQLFDSIEQTDLDDWNRVRLGDPELFMDPRFIATVEKTMAGEGKFWTLLVYDEQNRPMASACLSLLRVDGGLLTQGLIRRLIDAIRLVWRSFLFFKVLFVGLPVSGGQQQLRIHPHADVDEVIRALEAAVSNLAKQHRTRVTVMKEFDTVDAERLAGLKRLGYVQADSLPMNHLEPGFGSFDDYCRCRHARSRRNMLQSQRKFERAGMRLVQLTGAEGADRLLTDEVHQLYEAVVHKAHSQLEILPRGFFAELARQLGRRALFTFAYQGQRIVGFTCSLRSDSIFQMMFAGLDYAVNRQGDVYFNLIYKELDYAWRHGVSDIRLGQTADTFKARLGCRQHARYFFIKPHGVLAFLRPLAGAFFPSVAVLPPQVDLSGRKPAAERDREPASFSSQVEA